MTLSVWPHPMKLALAARSTPSNPLKRRLDADTAARAAIAKLLDIDGVESLSADLALSGWFDGVSLEGRIRATITQICGVSLEPFSTDIDSQFSLRAVPPTSPHAPAPDAEIIIDLEADDPPDVLEGDEIDLGAYVVEHLALEIDPMARKPGVVFEPPVQPPERSPFAVLKGFKDQDPES